MHLYGDDEFASILENVDKKMTVDYKKTRAAKVATAAHPVTVDVPNDLNWALSSKQMSLLNCVKQIFKDYDAGSVVMVGVNEAVNEAFVKLREEEEKKALLPPPMSPEDKKIADLEKQLAEAKATAASKDLETTALGVALATAVAASADQGGGAGASSSGEVIVEDLNITDSENEYDSDSDNF